MCYHSSSYCGNTTHLIFQTHIIIDIQFSITSLINTLTSMKLGVNANTNIIRCSCIVRYILPIRIIISLVVIIIHNNYYKRTLLIQISRRKLKCSVIINFRIIIKENIPGNETSTNIAVYYFRNNN